MPELAGETKQQHKTNQAALNLHIDHERKRKRRRMAANNKYTAPKAEEEGRHNDVIMIMITTGEAINPAQEQEIDLRHMDEQDVKSLKTNGE